MDINQLKNVVGPSFGGNLVKAAGAATDAVIDNLKDTVASPEGKEAINSFFNSTLVPMVKKLLGL